MIGDVSLFFDADFFPEDDDDRIDGTMDAVTRYASMGLIFPDDDEDEIDEYVRLPF